jgi:hypothetical protein
MRSVDPVPLARIAFPLVGRGREGGKRKRRGEEEQTQLQVPSRQQDTAWCIRGNGAQKKIPVLDTTTQL